LAKVLKLAVLEFNYFIVFIVVFSFVFLFMLDSISLLFCFIKLIIVTSYVLSIVEHVFFILVVFLFTFFPQE